MKKKNKKNTITASNKKTLKLKVLAKKKESVRRKLAVKAEKLRLKAEKLAVTAKEKESVRRRLAVKAEKLPLKAEKLAVTAKEKESVRRRLVVTAEKLAVTAKEKEDVRNKLVVTAKQLAVTAKEKEDVRRKLEVTAEKLAVTAKEKESVRGKLAVTAKEKEDVRNKLVVTAEKLAVTAKEKEDVRRKLAVTAKEKESVRNKLVVTAEKLAVTAKEKESVRNKLVVTAEKLAVTAKEKESVRHNLAVTAKQLAVTAKEKEDIRRNLAVTAKEKEDVRNNLALAAKQLAVTAKERETMLASIGDGLIASDEKGNITLINKTAERLLGQKSEEVMGKVFSEVMHIEDEKGIAIPLEKRPIIMALRAGKTTSTTTEGAAYYYVRPDKTRFPVAMIVTPVILEKKVIGTIEVFRDITREKEVDRAKSEFVSLASHQLRTPPTSMKWFLEMLLSGEVGVLNEKQKEYFGEVFRNNQRMITLVNTLLNVSRIELGVFAIEPEPTDLVVLTKGIIEEMKAQIREKELRVNEKYSKNLKLVFIDPKLLSIAIQDIISNSVKYTPPKGTINVEISLKKSGESIGGRLVQKDSLGVVVSDTGYGIPKDQQDKIFTKLFRASNVKEMDTDGTGLGLYLAKSIIDHAHGEIWFESAELNKGTKFYITIPIEGMKKREGVTKLTTGF